MSNQLKIYPSGFMGSSTVKQTEQPTLISTAKQILNTASINKGTGRTSSSLVNELWKITINDAKEYSTFEFKERILKCALEVFGEEFLADWLNAQYQNPDYCDNHSRWIDETIKFVYGNSQRDMSYNNWIVIFDSGSSSSVKKEHSPVVSRYLYSKGILENRSNITMRQFLMHWVRRADGINDLLASMNVLYGKR